MYARARVLFELGFLGGARSSAGRDNRHWPSLPVSFSLKTEKSFEGSSWHCASVQINWLVVGESGGQMAPEDTPTVVSGRPLGVVDDSILEFGHCNLGDGLGPAEVDKERKWMRFLFKFGASRGGETRASCKSNKDIDGPICLEMRARRAIDRLELEARVRCSRQPATRPRASSLAHPEVERDRSVARVLSLLLLPHRLQGCDNRA